MGQGSLVVGDGVWGDVIRTGGDDSNWCVALPSDLPNRTRCRPLYCRTRRASGQYYVGLGLARFDLAAPCDAACLCQSLSPLDLSGACRIFRSIVDGPKDANAKFRFYRLLYRGLFRGCALGLGVDAPKKGYSDWIDGSVGLDLGRRLA